MNVFQDHFSVKITSFCTFFVNVLLFKINEIAYKERFQDHFRVKITNFLECFIIQPYQDASRNVLCLTFLFTIG